MFEIIKDRISVHKLDAKTVYKARSDVLKSGSGNQPPARQPDRAAEMYFEWGEDYLSRSLKSASLARGLLPNPHPMTDITRVTLDHRIHAASYHGS